MTTQVRNIWVFYFCACALTSHSIMRPTKSNVFLCCTHGRKLLDAGGEDHVKGLEQTVPSAHSGLRIVPCPTNQTRKSYSSWDIGKFRRSFLSNRE